MDGKAKLEKLLKEKGHSITKPRLTIFSFLQEADAPLSVTEIVRNLKNIDKVSIYRTIELFEKTGIIHRVWTGFKSKVELSEQFSSHHHHFTCISCGRIVSLEDEALEKTLKKLEHANGFKLTHHSVELSGYCEKCR